MKIEIRDFFIWNKGTASTGVIWDTFKAYIHGILVAFKAFSDKRHRLIRVDLASNIQRMEEENNQGVSPKVVHQLQMAYDNLKPSFASSRTIQS